MPWVYSVGSGTPPSYTWFGLNTSNQHASPISFPSNCAVTQLKVYAAGRSSSVSTRLCLWSSGGSCLAQSSTFTMAVGSESVGGQAWNTKSITAEVISSGTYWVGLYRNPSGGHIAGTTASGTTGYIKTNTSSFPSVSSMSGYTSDDKRMYVGAFYITAPAAPSSFSCSRSSDIQINLAWTNNEDSDQPYDSVLVYRSVDGGSYSLKATLSGTVESYSDTSTSANHKYCYKVKARNSAGDSSYSSSDCCNTTPATPTGIIGTRVGTTVVLTWDNPANNDESVYIERNTSADNVSWAGYSALTVPDLAANSITYTDSAPANYNYYRVRTECTDPTLNSSWNTSALVQILTPPAAPSNLQPDNLQGIDIDNAIPITWTHNTIDGSGQTYFKIRFREVGGAWSLYVNKTARTESYSNVSTASFSVGEWEYEVSTWGACTSGGLDGTGQGAYSETCSFTLEHLPIGTINVPNGIDDYPYSVLNVEWSYTQAESYSQVQYLCNLYDENDNLLESKTASSSSENVTFNYNLENSTDYKVTLQVQEENGLWSELSTVEFTTDFYTPPVPTMVLNKNETNGTVLIEITNPSPTGDEVETSYNNIYRSIDGGLTYELAIENIPVNTAVTDYIPLISGTTYYYIEAISDIPSIAVSTPDYVEMILTGRYYINGGSNYSDYIELKGDIALNEIIELDSIIVEFEGRNYPVKYQGSKESQIISFSCDLPYTDYDTVKEIILTAGNNFFRDFRNRWIECNISNCKFDKKDNSAYQFNCIITKVESE